MQGRGPLEQDAINFSKFQCRKRQCYDARGDKIFFSSDGVCFNAASGNAMMQDCRREAIGDGAPGTFLENLGLFFDDSLIFRQNVFTIPGKNPASGHAVPSVSVSCEKEENLNGHMRPRGLCRRFSFSCTVGFIITV